MTPLAISPSPVQAVLRVVGLGLGAGAITALVAFVYRARVRSQFPDGATLILGWGVVAIYLNTRLVFVRFVGEAAVPLSVSEAALNVAVLAVAAVASYVGRNLGDRAGQSKRLGGRRFKPTLSPIVRATGRFITVELPQDIEDIVGYDPVPEETKAALAGDQLDFPRGLTVEELETQVTERLEAEHAIGTVDVDLASDGTVEYLAVGQRRAGIGPTLPPGVAAVAVRADPPFSASAGDTVQLWRSAEGTAAERIGLGELRANVGPVVTLALDEDAAATVDPTETHRLMTLSADSYPDREFAAMLRRAEETMGIVAIGAGSPLVGVPLAALDITVIAIRTGAGEIETIPPRDRVVEAGAGLFAIGTPDEIRRLETTTGTRPGDSSGTHVRGVDLEPAAAQATDGDDDD